MVEKGEKGEKGGEEKSVYSTKARIVLLTTIITINYLLLSGTRTDINNSGSPQKKLKN